MQGLRTILMYLLPLTQKTRASAAGGSGRRRCLVAVACSLGVTLRILRITT